MKCPKCSYEQAIYDDLNAWWYCPQCHGTGEVQMTNEEYLRSCNTEQLAEWIIGIDYGTDDKDIKIAKLVEWLKQPHTPKE